MIFWVTTEGGCSRDSTRTFSNSQNVEDKDIHARQSLGWFSEQRVPMGNSQNWKQVQPAIWLSVEADSSLDRSPAPSTPLTWALWDPSREHQKPCNNYVSLHGRGHISGPGLQPWLQQGKANSSVNTPCWKVVGDLRLNNNTNAFGKGFESFLQSQTYKDLYPVAQPFNSRYLSKRNVNTCLWKNKHMH